MSWKKRAISGKDGTNSQGDGNSHENREEAIAEVRAVLWRNPSSESLNTENQNGE